MSSCHGCVWDGLAVGSGPTDAPIAIGGVLDPATVLGAYRHGLISIPATSAEGVEINHALYEDLVAGGAVAVVDAAGGDPYGLTWWSPDPRPVVRLGELAKPRTLMQQLRNRLPWTTTVNRAFPAVLEECRGAGRTPAWLTDDLCAAMTGLHELGWAHSVEVRDGDTLVGGLIGVGLGSVFALDTGFYLQTNASKVALLDLEDRLGGTPVRLLDFEWDSDRNRRYGAVPAARRDFLAAVGQGSAPVTLDERPAEVRRLGFGRQAARPR